MNQPLSLPTSPPRQQLSQLRNGPRPSPRDSSTRFSQPKPTLKINLHKLPLDFFPKRTHSTKHAHPSVVRHLIQQQSVPLVPFRRAETERAVPPHQKTSFFGCFQEENHERPAPGPRIMGRRFETREEVKREALPLGAGRKLTTAATAQKKDILDLYPCTYDQQLSEMAHGRASHHLRHPMRKQPQSTRQLNDPEKAHTEGALSAREGPSFQSETALPGEKEEMLITFFNAKSSCFPPINRGRG